MEVQEQDLYRQLTTFYWENDLRPDEEQIERLIQFAELVINKNSVINLVSRKDIQSIIENHIFISAYISKFIPERCFSYIDIGTGGGFPGIPVAIVKPEMRGVLVDSIAKKTKAVEEFIEKLMLSNVKVENSRVEDPEFIARHHGSFDLVVSRATVPLIVLMRYALPLIKQKAWVLAMKGGDIAEEFDAMYLKFKHCIKKHTVYELHYKPTNLKNVKGKKLVLLEINK
ncbi:MAG: 16S rRNA (guanine(527)-N(7))-methyltransferase RsmG [Ignavibacteriaceae bacterium]|nr:16S rRNA (guanine(527)-N(7))-methyltransferase RsmG [Ignavibacteriaceae bacterium]